MTTITNEYMRSMLATIKAYNMVLLKPGPNMAREDAKEIIWEHARRNFALRADGKLSIVAPVTIQADVLGLYVFNIPEEEINAIMKEDPAVESGIFTFDIYPCKSFPGDSLK